jgi:hypothetical protein
MKQQSDILQSLRKAVADVIVVIHMIMYIGISHF